MRLHSGHYKGFRRVAFDIPSRLHHRRGAFGAPSAWRRTLVHFDNNIRAAVTTFWEQTFEMLETQHLDIIAHFDKIKMHNRDRFFTEDERWYKTLADKAIQLIKRHNVIIEVNTRGLYKKRCNHFYPSTELLMKARKADIPVIVSSDAHKAEELTLFVLEAIAELERCGFDHTARFDVVTGKFVY